MSESGCGEEPERVSRVVPERPGSGFPSFSRDAPVPAHAIVETLLAAAGESLPVERFGVSASERPVGEAPFVACIPARDEEGHVEGCLRSLDRDLGEDDVLVFLANGCRDATVALAHRALAGWTRPFVLLECDWRPGQGSAPRARRLAFDVAHRLAPRARLLSLDADTFVLPGLRAAYEEEFARGYDLVCGRIGFIEREAALLPHADEAAQAVVREYREGSRRLAALMAPDRDNPWPHHGNIGGANFAISGTAYARAGPMPTPAFGEDRALRRRCEALGLRVRYSDAPRVETSCRLDGRAPGGLADELRRERTEIDPVVDELLEPPARLLLRLQTRAAFLEASMPGERKVALQRLGIVAAETERLSAAGGIAAWHEVEALAPALQGARLRLADLRRFLPELQALLSGVREAPADNPRFPSRARS